MAERIKIAIRTDRVACFVELLSKQLPEYTLIFDGMHTMVTVEAEASWLFFYLGVEWGQHLLEGAQENG